MRVVFTIAAALLLGGTSLFARNDSAVSVTTNSTSVTAHAYATKKGILVGGSVNRALGLGSGGGSIRVCVYFPKGEMVSCKSTHVTYPARRPIVRSRVGSFATTVQAEPGSTIRVGGCPQC
jgi:hypothetical protein